MCFPRQQRYLLIAWALGSSLGGYRRRKPQATSQRKRQAPKEINQWSWKWKQEFAFLQWSERIVELFWLNKSKEWNKRGMNGRKQTHRPQGAKCSAVSQANQPTNRSLWRRIGGCWCGESEWPNNSFFLWAAKEGRVGGLWAQSAICRREIPLHEALHFISFHSLCPSSINNKKETSLPINQSTTQLACLSIIDGAEVGCGVSLSVGPKTYNPLQENPTKLNPTIRQAKAG